MRVIRQYPVPSAEGLHEVEMPRGEILSFAAMDGELVIWALVDPAQPKVGRKLALVQTDNDFDDARTMKYIGTAPGYARTYATVWHLFEVFG